MIWRDISLRNICKPLIGVFYRKNLMRYRNKHDIQTLLINISKNVKISNFYYVSKLQNAINLDLHEFLKKRILFLNLFLIVHPVFNSTSVSL